MYPKPLAVSILYEFNHTLWEWPDPVKREAPTRVAFAIPAVVMTQVLLYIFLCILHDEYCMIHSKNMRVCLYGME